MNICRKCSNTNIILNGIWKQCASCGEVHEKQSVMLGTHTLPTAENHNLMDIALSPIKFTFMGKLISRLHLIS